MVYTRDNFESLRVQLEQASKIVTSSNVTKEQRVQSENLFVEFHKSKSPYEFCRYLLETSKEPYIVYQAVSTLQEATLREWSLLPNDLIIELQNFLLNFVNYSISNFNNSGDKYIQRHILQTLAVFYKRSKLDSCMNKQSATNSKDTNMVKDVIEMFKSPSLKIKQMCCSLMLALLNEFSNSNKSTKLGLPNDSHFTAKRLFEQNEFKLMLIFVFETTQNLINSLKENNINSIKLLDNDSKEMLMQLFALIDQSFSWEFTSSKHILKNLIGSQSNNTNSSIINLEPTPEFKEFFLNANLISLLFECYELVRDDPDMAHASIQSIIQLSTLTGPIFNDDVMNAQTSGIQLRVTFFNNFLQCFLSSFTKFQIKEYEIFNLACLVENILSPINMKKVHLINIQLIDAFFQLVCGFVINGFKIEKACQDPFDSKKYLESYEKVLIAWTSIKDILLMSETSTNSGEHFNLIFRNYSKPIVEAFVHSRLSSFGFETDNENIQLNNDGVECESIDDEESNEDDLHRYKEILYSIGEFSKYTLDFCLPMLANLLNEKFVQLSECLNQILQSKELSANTIQLDLNLVNKHMTKLSEDIHWILLISGFILFEISSDGDQAKIPKEIMTYSINFTKFLDINLINKLFNMLNPSMLSPIGSPSSSKTNVIQSIPTSLALIETRLTQNEMSDPIILILFNTFQLCEMESYMFSLNMLEHLSPQVASTLMWFLKELSRSYLFMSEKDYEEISATLQLIFGQDTQCGIILLNFLLKKIYSNFYIWSAENTTTSQTAKLLLEIVKHKEMSKVLIQNDKFWSISKIAIANEMPWILLPSSVKKLIIKSLIVSCNITQNNLHDSNNSMQLHIFNNIINPLNERFNQLSSVKSESIHTESCIKEVMSLIETFNGVIEGASKYIINDLLPFVVPRLQQGVQLLDVYHNYGEIVELILCMFNGTIEKFLVHLNDSSDAKNQIYHCFLCLIQVFSSHNSGKRSVEANIEEDYYNDLLLFMTLLNTLHNFDNDTNEPTILNNIKNSETNNQLTSVDIILIGLKFLIPLMNQEMLKFQALSIEYFKLISHMAYTNPDKIFAQPFELFSTLISSIQYGINSGLGNEVLRLSLQCIGHLCNRVFVTQTQQREYASCLRNLFKIVFDMIFRISFEMELAEVYSSVLYSLICCFQDTYSILVGQLVEQYTDNNIKQKIIEGFSSLTPSNFVFTMEKRNRLKFSTKFNEFCVKTYSLLFIK